MTRNSGSLSNKPASWLAPLVVVATLFYLYPILDVVRLSFTSSSLLQDITEYGLSSYRNVLSDRVFYASLRTTLVFIAANAAATVTIGLTIALALDRAKTMKLPGALAVRSVVLASWVMPGVIVGILWSLLLSEARYGMVNLALDLIGIGPLRFLSSGAMAVVSILVANVWRGAAFAMILQYAALQNIDRSLYEAADVDGATALRRLWHITLPQLRPVLLINVVLSTVFTLNTFDMILALTGGGPGRSTEVLSLLLYRTIFVEYRLGQGSVVAMVILLVGTVIALSYRAILSEDRSRPKWRTG